MMLTLLRMSLAAETKLTHRHICMCHVETPRSRKNTYGDDDDYSVPERNPGPLIAATNDLDNFLNS